MKKIYFVLLAIVVSACNYSTNQIAAEKHPFSNTREQYLACIHTHNKGIDIMANAQQERECNTCQGSGQVNCSQCKGKGYIVCSVCTGNGWIKCSTCNGTGRYYIMGEYITCPQCDGLKAKRCYRCNGYGRRDCCRSGKKACPVCKGYGTIR